MSSSHETQNYIGDAGVDDCKSCSIKKTHVLSHFKRLTTSCEAFGYTGAMAKMTVSEYIAKAPKEWQKALRTMRALLKKAAPGATEEVKWGAPTFAYKRILFAYAAYAKHISLMPTPAVITAFKKELRGYKTGKGSVQFPYDTPLPKALITKLAKRRVKDAKENDVRWM
jgi:uncharacterized protein YdhG (YjbR/CyaY superfamily)